MSLFLAYYDQHPCANVLDAGNEGAIQSALAYYRSLYGESSAQSPCIYRAPWGWVMFWRGVEDRLSEYGADDRRLHVTLGYALNTRIDQPALEALLVQESQSRDVGIPIRQPWNSLGIFCHVYANNAGLACMPDPFGAYPVYYTHRHARIVIGNDPILTQLMGAGPSTLCEGAAWEYVVTEGNLEHNLLVRDCERLRANCALIVPHCGPKRVLEYPALQGHMSASDLQELLISGIRQVAQRTPVVVCKLTGGYDSRLNLAACCAAGVACVAVTYRSPEVAIAREIATAAGVKHMVIEPGKRGSAKEKSDTWNGHRLSDCLWLSGAGGALGQVHYLNGWNGVSKPFDTVLDTYLAAKRKACLSSEHWDAVEHSLHKRWSVLQGECNGDAIACAARLYWDRERTWSGPGWAKPKGGNHVAPLMGWPLVYFGSMFRVEERIVRGPHRMLTKTLVPGLERHPYYVRQRSIGGQMFSRLPRSIQVAGFRMKYLKCGSVVATEASRLAGMPAVRELFTEREIRNLLVSNPAYVRSACEWAVAVRTIVRSTV